MTALTLSSLGRSLGLSPRGRTVQGAAPAVVAAGLIAEWRFDVGTGQMLTDLSGNGHHGQLGSTAGADTNDPSWATSPARLDFDGADDYVIIPAFAGPDEYHLDVVARQPATTGIYSMLFVAHGTGDSTAILQLFRDLDQNHLRYRVRHTGGTSDIVGVTDIYDDQWHLIQVSRSASEFWVNIDGHVAISPQPVGAPPASSNDVSTFGIRLDAGFAMQGSLAWAAWYSTAFDETRRAQNEQFARDLMSGRGVTLP